MSRRVDVSAATPVVSEKLSVRMLRAWTVTLTMRWSPKLRSSALVPGVAQLPVVLPETSVLLSPIVLLPSL